MDVVWPAEWWRRYRSLKSDATQRVPTTIFDAEREVGRDASPQGGTGRVPTRIVLKEFSLGELGVWGALEFPALEVIVVRPSLMRANEDKFVDLPSDWGRDQLIHPVVAIEQGEMRIETRWRGHAVIEQFKRRVRRNAFNSEFGAC